MQRKVVQLGILVNLTFFNASTSCMDEKKLISEKTKLAFYVFDMVSKNNLVETNLLLKQGASPNSTTIMGEALWHNATPLSMAVNHGNIEMVKTLLCYGAIVGLFPSKFNSHYYKIPAEILEPNTSESYKLCHAWPYFARWLIKQSTNKDTFHSSDFLQALKNYAHRITKPTSVEACQLLESCFSNEQIYEVAEKEKLEPIRMVHEISEEFDPHYPYTCSYVEDIGLKFALTIILDDSSRMKYKLGNQGSFNEKKFWETCPTYWGNSRTFEEINKFCHEQKK